MTAVFAQFGFLSNIQIGDNLEVDDHIVQTLYQNANQATIGHSRRNSVKNIDGKDDMTATQK